MSEKSSLEMMATLQDTLSKLRVKYIDHLSERIAELEALRKKSIDQVITEDELVQLRHQAHTLAGNGATYGFESISETAKNLEDFLWEDNIQDTGKLVELISALVQACRNASDEG